MDDSLSTGFGSYDEGTILMSNDNKPPSYKLTFEDAKQVWRRHRAGEYQNRIAALFDVNPGRVNEVLKEHIHIGSRVASESAA
jgi:hypothetical protein